MNETNQSKLLTKSFLLGMYAFMYVYRNVEGLPLVAISIEGGYADWAEGRGGPIGSIFPNSWAKLAPMLPPTAYSLQSAGSLANIILGTKEFAGNSLRLATDTQGPTVYGWQSSFPEDAVNADSLPWIEP